MNLKVSIGLSSKTHIEPLSYTKCTANDPWGIVVGVEKEPRSVGLQCC